MSAEPSAAAEEAKQRLPDFFIVGHHKSGTTAIYAMLRRHPEIYMPGIKEPRYFASDLRALVRRPERRLRTETFDEYLSLFQAAAPGQRVGEASPSYLRSHMAAAEIAAVQPGARIIAILREPASFVRSLHLQLLQEHVESEPDLRKAVAGEQIVRGGEPVQRYSDHVHYVAQLRRYHEAFPRENVLVLIYEDFRRDNEATLRRVLQFLEVDDTSPIEVIEANPSLQVRHAKLDRLTRKLASRHDPVSRAVKAVTPRGLRNRTLRAFRRSMVYGEPRPADEEFMLELRRRFKPEVVALSEYLDRDLVALWGYEHVD